MIRLTVVLLCSQYSVQASASESYLCVADMGTGFVFDNTRKQWRISNFKAEGKYVVIKSTRKGYVREVKKIGETSVVAYCKNDFNEYGALSCERLYQFRMNKNNLRYLLIYPVGYWTDNKNAPKHDPFAEGEDTPRMEIGKCSPL